MNDDEVKITVRLPPELHAKLIERARTTRRSLNSEVITLLERFVDSREIGVPLRPESDGEDAKAGGA